MADNVAKIVLTAEDRTAAALASLRAGLGGLTKDVGVLRGVLSQLVPVLSFAGAISYFKHINDGVDALNDLKDATGASIENISALEDVAARTGTSFDTVGTALVKFNAALNDSAPDSDISEALKAIGLSAAELKKVDPAEALRRTAVALAGFADDGNKARLVQELFGKSLKEVAPLLNDLATQSELVAKVTTQQADEAEKFNHQLSELSKNAKDAGRVLTADLVQGLNAAAKAFKDSGFIEGMQTLLTGTDEFKASKALVQDTEKLLYLEKALQTARAEGYKDGSRVIDNLKAQKAQVEENIRVTQNYLKVLRGDDKPAGAKDDKPVVEFDKDAAKKAAEAAKKFAEEVKRLQAQDRTGLVGGIDARLKEEEEIDDLLRKQIDERNAYELDAREKMMKQFFETIDMEQEAAIESAQQVMRAAEEDANKLNSIGRDLGMTFSSAFEDAVLEGKNLDDLLQALARDVERIILRKNVTEKLAASIAGINWGSLFGTAFGTGGGGTGFTGNASGADMSVAFAGGGYTGSGSRSGGLDGQGGFWAVMHPQETVIDHAQGQSAGAQIVYSPSISIDSRTDRAEVFQLVSRAVQNGHAQLVDQLTRTGRL